MSKTVFILGAGASREACGPLMKDFVETAQRIHRERDADWAGGDFDLVFRARSRLQRAWSKAQLNIDNIEHLFAAFEMSSLLGYLPETSPKDLDSLIGATRNVITRTLERTLRWPVLDGFSVHPPVPYDVFAELVALLHRDPSFGPVSVMTFNYDLAADYALMWRGFDVNYCLSEAAEVEPKEQIRLMKLHGSLNWVSDANKQIAPIPVQKIEKAGSRGALYRLNTAEILSASSLFKSGGVHPPVIVPPTWSKGEHQARLAMVWRHAAESLREAENIVVVGYSLPPTDQYFRQFYALSSISDAILERFWVIDPGVNADQFKGIIAQAVHARGCFCHFQSDFGNGLIRIAELMKLPSRRLKVLCERAQIIRGGDYGRFEDEFRRKLADVPEGT